MTAKSTEKLGATEAHPLASCRSIFIDWTTGRRIGRPSWCKRAANLAIARNAADQFGPTRRALLQSRRLPWRKVFSSNLHKTQLTERGDADFAYANSFGRYRTSVVRQRLGVDLVFRIINTKVRTMDELGLPEHLKLLTRYQNGLILVTGSVGSGKSTTLAALVEQVNIERREHIITLEDPIEYIFEPKGCHITQREVHTHTRSFAAALRGALREDPDVIMVGEMRDLETISLAHHRRGDGPFSFRNAAHRQCFAHTRSIARRLSTGSTESNPHHGQRIVAWRH